MCAVRSPDDLRYWRGQLEWAAGRQKRTPVKEQARIIVGIVKEIELGDEAEHLRAEVVERIDRLLGVLRQQRP